MLSAPLSFGGSAEGMISRVNFDGEEELSAEAALLFFGITGRSAPSFENGPSVETPE